MSRSVDPIIAQIQRARERLGWSQQELADRAKVHVSTVAGLEAGRHRGHVSTASDLAAAMGLELRLAPKPKAPDPLDAIAERRRIVADALAGGRGRHR